jgi:hypothetical protein
MSVFYFVNDECLQYAPAGVVTHQEAGYFENELDALLGWGYNPSSGFYRPYVVHEPGQPDYQWPGIPVIASANNLDNDAGDTTPARMAYHNAANFISGGHVISVGGLDEGDHRWKDWDSSVNDACGQAHMFGSNYGPTVDIYAAAHDITGAWVTSDTSYTASKTLSGTSFSAPIVAGIIARLQERYGQMLPEDAWTQLQASSVFPPTGGQIEPYWPHNNNKMIARLPGQLSCSPEYP